MKQNSRKKVGAHYQGRGQCKFLFWAPFLTNVYLNIVSPQERLLPMSKDEEGYWSVLVAEVYPGTRYFYRLDTGQDRPDPASYFQPEGVHLASAVVDQNSFHWEDNMWRGLPLEQMIIYEIHLGTFTSEGTFEPIIPRLDSLLELGVNTLEIMPVSQFPGERNWGYDGVYPFAVQNSYGGTEGLKRLVNICHKKGIAVILDVVYNHLGPEGNYTAEYAPYFTEKYRTPWGKAINFDDAYSDQVRNFFIQNALYWFEDYHIDGLRLDAIHGIYDLGARHILEELAQEVEYLSSTSGKKHYLIAESDLNDVRVIKKKDEGGYGIDAQWSDDFHHSLHTFLTGDKSGYYEDFGRESDLLKSFKEGFVYSWRYSQHRKRYHGSFSADLPGQQFVVFIQNHDQVGNRMFGERLSVIVSFDALKLAAASLIFSPCIPLFFMGEEYAEEIPFLYFVSHSDENLIRAVREGRKREFASFQWQGEPPDPQDIQTFLNSKLGWEKQNRGKHAVMRDFYKELLRLRRVLPALAHLDKKSLKVWGEEGTGLIFLQRWHSNNEILLIMNFNRDEANFNTNFLEGKGKKILDSSDEKWMGTGSTLPDLIEKGEGMIIKPFSCALYEMEV
ncbi:MAG: malto-oligosyltrehalose trehalohydrolase [bacterium]